jgi:hypothetical protein
MNEPPRRSTTFRIVALVLLALPIAGMAIVLRVEQLFRGEPYYWREPETPFPGPALRRLRLSPSHAAALAIEYVKQHDGWTGVADPPELGEEYLWWVVVRRGSKPSDEKRELVVDDKTGKVRPSR